MDGISTNHENHHSVRKTVLIVGVVILALIIGVYFVSGTGGGSPKVTLVSDAVPTNIVDVHTPVTLSWSTQNISNGLCFASTNPANPQSEDGGVWSGVKSLSGGNQMFVPSENTQYTLRCESINYVEQYVKASNTGFDDRYGTSLAADGKWMVVGAPYENSTNPADPSDNSGNQVGAAYVLENQGGVWTEVAYLKHPTPANGDHFGEDVSISGDYIAVGAPGDGTGSVNVFKKNPDDTWVFHQTLTSGETFDDLGKRIDIDGGYIIAGSASESSGDPLDPSDNSELLAGAVYVYEQQPDGFWIETAYLKSPDPESFDQFGRDVAISGNIAVVGVLGDDSGIAGDSFDNSSLNSGAVYIFERQPGGMWLLMEHLKGSNTDPGDGLGDVVEIDGNRVVVSSLVEASGTGSPQDNSMPDAGAVYLFESNGSSWQEIAYLKPNIIEADHFGDTIAIEGSLVVVGAPWESSDGSDPSNNSQSRSGAVYLFQEQEDNTWQQIAYLKASDTTFVDTSFPGFRGDNFSTVALNAGRVFVGALWEDGNGTDPSNNSVENSGAAYIFTNAGSLLQEDDVIVGVRPNVSITPPATGVYEGNTGDVTWSVDGLWTTCQTTSSNSDSNWDNVYTPPGTGDTVTTATLSQPNPTYTIRCENDSPLWVDPSLPEDTAQTQVVITYCGDTFIQGSEGEVCDSNNFGGLECDDYPAPGGGNYTGGNLTCISSCQAISTSACTEGSGTQCDNTSDDDGDGVEDADDPGCWDDPLDSGSYNPARTDESANRNNGYCEAVSGENPLTAPNDCVISETGQF